MFRVITLNANGIRAAARKGFFTWLKKQKADVVCIQETKAQEYQLTDDCFRPAGYYCYYEDAVKKGYSGTAIYTRHEPKKVVRGWGVEEFDNEGRYLEVQLGFVSVVSLYLPSGSSGEARQAAKYRFLDDFTPYLQKLRRRRPEYILCGDWNIAHKEIDLANPSTNRKNAGFTDEEREGFTNLLEGGFLDTFRHLYPDQTGAYSWWSYRAGARSRNVGWRIDYFLVSKDLATSVREANIYSKIEGSDHCPVGLSLANA